MYTTASEQEIVDDDFDSWEGGREGGGSSTKYRKLQLL